MSHPLHRYVCQQVGEQLLSHRVVVFYDPRREFEPFFEELPEAGPGEAGLPRVILDSQPDPTAHLARYEGSFFGLRAAIEPIVEKDQPDFLVVYVPGVTRDRLGSVLMEVEKGGFIYGVHSSQGLRAVARRLLGKIYSEGQIDELLRADDLQYQDVIALLSQAEHREQASLLRTIFGGATSEELLARWLMDESLDGAIEGKGALGELLKLLETRLGLSLDAEIPVGGARAKALRYVLVGEFRSDLRCDPPPSVGKIPVPPSAGALKRIRALASRMRKEFPNRYEVAAVRVEQDLGLSSAEIDPEHLGSIDTFRLEERSLLSHASRLIANKQYQGALEVVAARARSFWVDREVGRQAQWEACRLMAELGDLVEQIRPKLSSLGVDANAWVEAYSEPQGWHRVDRVQRTLEAWVAKMDEEAEAERALGVVRREHETLLHEMALGFSKALEAAGWSLDGLLHQSRVYPETAEKAHGRVAYFLVDALRFEMGAELAQQLDQATELALKPAIAALPTVTPVGMAALLPGASTSFSVVEHKGTLAARVGGTALPGSAERMKYLRALRPDAQDIDLNKLLEVSSKSLERRFGSTPLLVVRSQEIDLLGEASGGYLARHVMDTVIANVARAVRKLAKLGFETFVVTADHGHQFAVRKEEDMLLDKPGGATVDLHRRCWAGHGGQTAAACVRVTAAELGYDSDLEFVFPRGLAVFKAGGDLAYHHGGISLQEVVVPVLTFRIPASQPVTEARVMAHLTGLPDVITNRTFGLRVEVIGDLFQQEPVPLRVALFSEGAEVGRAGMALDARIDRATGTVHLKPGVEVSVGVMLTRDDCKTVRVVVLDPTTDAVLGESADLPVKLGI